MEKLGLALGGGGLKGVAYIGAFKALRELNVNVEYLSGTSSGSIFATLFALDYTDDEMLKKVKDNYKYLIAIDKKKIVLGLYSFIRTRTVNIKGIMNDKSVSQLIKSIGEQKKVSNMNQIKIPYAVCTVDTISTKECIFLSKEIKNKQKDIDYLYDVDIERAIRSSMAFPGIFSSVNYDKYNFIDGGTKDNLPVQVLMDMGATKTLALNFKLDEYTPTDDVLAVLLRTCDIFSQKDVLRAQEKADYFIEISAPGSSLLSLDDFDKLVDIGYNAIMDNKEKILELVK